MARSQAPEWQGQVRGAAYPCRKKAAEGKEDNVPIPWLNTPQLPLSPRPQSKLFPPLLPGSVYNSPHPAQKRNPPSAQGSSVTAT